MPHRTTPFRLLLGLALGLGGVAAGASVAGCSKSEGAAPSYQARGVIKSFGPDHQFVSIAHDAIPGYMAAMTMSFEPDTPSRLDGLAAGDRVSFAFKDQGGKRTITSMKKEP